MSDWHCVFSFYMCLILQQSRQAQVPYAPSAASPTNPAKSVAVVSVVLGLGTADNLVVAQKSITHGTRACKPAKHGRGPGQSLPTS